MREPLERENGRFVNELPELREFAAKVVDDLCNKYPDVDIIDIRYCFELELPFQFTMAMMEGK